MAQKYHIFRQIFLVRFTVWPAKTGQNLKNLFFPWKLFSSSYLNDFFLVIQSNMIWVVTIRPSLFEWFYKVNLLWKCQSIYFLESFIFVSVRTLWPREVPDKVRLIRFHHRELKPLPKVQVSWLDLCATLGVYLEDEVNGVQIGGDHFFLPKIIVKHFYIVFVD